MAQINIQLTDVPNIPASGKAGLFIKTSGEAFLVDDAGVENPLAGSGLVDLTTNQTIGGIKTFTENVVANKALLLDDANTLYQENGKGSIQYTETDEKFYFGNPLDASTNKYLVLRMDGMTATRVLTAPNVDGEIALIAEERENDTVLFDKNYVTGNPAVRTGNITFSFTGAKLGSVTRILHNSGTKPTIPSEAILISGSYTISVDNYIWFCITDIGSGTEKVEVTVSQELTW